MDRETLARLAQPLDLRITRSLPDNAGPGKAGKLYLPGYEHTRTANQIFGWDWSDEVLEHGLAYQEQVELPGKNGGPPTKMWSVGYWTLVKVTAAGVTHTGMGFCDSLQRSKGDACSMAYVGAVTEGRKSALEQFGDRFGLGLKDATDQDGQKYIAELEMVGASAPPPLPPIADPSPATTTRTISPPPATAPAPATQTAASTAPAANADEAALRKKLDEATSLFWKATEAKLGRGHGYLPRAVVQAGIAKPADIRTFPVDRIPSLLDAVRTEWSEAGLKAA